MTISARSASLDFGPQPALEAGLSELARSLRGSIILGIAADVRELQATGKPLCNLTVGDFDPRQFPIPIPFRDGLIDALRAGETNYPPSDGLLPLRQAIVEYTSREHGIEYPVSSVLVTAGGRPAIYGIFRCVVDPGDRVLYSVPSWNNDYYAEMVGAEKIPVAARPEHRFQPVLDDLAPHLAATRLLCLCSPGNPTGTVIDPEALRGILLAVVEENHRRKGRKPLFLLYDFMYGSLLQHGIEPLHPLALVPEAAPWVITVDGISKSFAATGLRVGWTIGAPPVIARMKDFLGHVGAWAPRPEQVATAGFLRDPEAIAEFRRGMTDALGDRLDALHEGFAAMKREGLPVDSVRAQGAMYVSLQVDLIGKRLGGRVIANNEELRRALLTEAGLAAVPFQAFGVPEHSGWFRLSVGAVSLEDIRQMLERVGALLGELWSGGGG
jgi:aspartate aminotransferase